MLEQTYRFLSNLEVAAPICAPDLVASRSPGSCSNQNIPGQFADDVLTCGTSRKVYHSNPGFGLMHPNPDAIIGESYTIQMYVRTTGWGSGRTRIIDFSDGGKNEGIYFKNGAGPDDRCIGLDPVVNVGACPDFNRKTYYLLTLTRNAASEVVTLYADGKLLTTYRDVNKLYVGKAGVPVYFFRDDRIMPCETGEVSFAYLSVSNKPLEQDQVMQQYANICFTSTINQTADFLINPNPACGTAEVKVAYTGILPSETGFAFQWTFDGATIVSGSGKGPFVIRWDTVGKKFVSLTIINNACGNKIVNIKQTAVSKLPEISLAVEPDECKSQMALTVKAERGSSPFTYSLDSITFQPSQVFTLKAGKYKIFVKDNNGCVKDTSTLISPVSSTLVKTIQDTTICLGQEIHFVTTGDAESYNWLPATGLDDPTAKDPYASPEQNTDYIVTAAKGACVLQDTVRVKVIQEIKVNLTPDATVAANIPYQLNASSDQLAGLSDVRFLWSPSIGLNSDRIPNPKATIVSSQTYTVTVLTPQGCGGTGKVSLIVLPPAWINLPDVFTPNGDNSNELLKPVFNRISSLHYLKIYDRWGDAIFVSRQLTEGWDGRFKGTQMDGGTYVWKMEAVTSEGEVIQKNGVVLLVR